MDRLFQHIAHYAQLSEEAREALEASFQQLVLKKQDHLLEEGRICRHLYFLQQGAIRGYYRVDGKEITHWFAFENDFVTSFHSFITQQASVENLQMLEGGILWMISKEKLEALFDQFHELERLVRIAYEKYYIRLEERYVNAHFKSAAERYEQLVHTNPHILERVPLGLIASFLGISQETLSRIRSRF